MNMVFTTTREEELTSKDDTASQTHLTTDTASATTRRCLVEGKLCSKTKLIRFVLDPENNVIPDLAERLPGRGMWVTASLEALQNAVRKNLFSKAAKTSAKVDKNLPEQVEALLRRRCLDILGLARGAGLVITGQPQVEQAQKARDLSFVLVAADAGSDGTKKLHHSTIINCALTRTQLGDALGRDQLVYIGLKPHSLSEKLLVELTRWQGMNAEVGK